MSFWKRKRPEDRKPDRSAEPQAPEWPDPQFEILGCPILDLGRKELFEEGFQFCGKRLREIYAAAGIDILLDHDAELPADIDLPDDEIIRWLWVDETCLIEDRSVSYLTVSFEDADAQAFNQLDWELIEQLRLRYKTAETERNWHTGAIDEGTLLILCRGDQLAEIEAHPNFPGYRDWTRNLDTVTSVERNYR